MSLENDLKSVIISGLKLEDVSPDEINEDTPLFGEGLGLDSLDAVELVVLIKKNFNVEIKEMEEAKEAFRSIKTLAAYIRLHQGK
ncbi:MAG: acyl carrier protein [Lentisphaerae bacterium GWF2_44_16]|nr:MAG: acyl carrier protein [Lentisphaerae bacterium GWF2_44_16]